MKMVYTSTGSWDIDHEMHDHSFAEANVAIAILAVILFLTLLFEVGRRSELQPIPEGKANASRWPMKRWWNIWSTNAFAMY